eukprot:1404900-Pyramimonas_sp.AAC.1
MGLYGIIGSGVGGCPSQRVHGGSKAWGIGDAEVQALVRGATTDASHHEPAAPARERRAASAALPKASGAPN